jgi:hypothetical protein
MQFAIMQLSEAKQGSKDEINVCKTRFKWYEAYQELKKDTWLSDPDVEEITEYLNVKYSSEPNQNQLRWEVSEKTHQVIW